MEGTVVGVSMRVENDMEGRMAYRCVGGDSVNIDIIKHNILGADEESGPAWRILEVKSGDLDVGSIVC